MPGKSGFSILKVGEGPVTASDSGRVFSRARRLSTTAATIARLSAPAPTQTPMMIGREMLEEEEEYVAPGKGGD